MDAQEIYSSLEKVPEPEFRALAERIEALGIKAEVFY